MSYNNTPFNFYGTQTDQVKIDLDNANNNFTIIANAFKDNSPDTGIVKNADAVGGFTPSQTPTPNAIPVAKSDGKIDIGWLPPISGGGSSSCVDLTNASSDYNLSVGECAIINFTDATSVSLHIATQDGTVYQMFILPSAGYLLPNNTSYSGQFSFGDWGYTSDGNNLSSTLDVRGSDAFQIGNITGKGSVLAIVYNFTNRKNITYFHNADFTPVGGGGYSYRTGTSYWKDTNTAWTSLGTITFRWVVSGQILVGRIL
jgi:hypothetical protein